MCIYKNINLYIIAQHTDHNSWHPPRQHAIHYSLPSLHQQHYPHCPSFTRLHIRRRHHTSDISYISRCFGIQSTKRTRQSDLLLPLQQSSTKPKENNIHHILPQIPRPHDNHRRRHNTQTHKQRQTTRIHGTEHTETPRNHQQSPCTHSAT